MVIQNKCEVNREHSRICSGILWTRLNQTEWSHNKNFYLKIPQNEVIFPLLFLHFSEYEVLSPGCSAQPKQFLENIRKWRHESSVDGGTQICDTRHKSVGKTESSFVWQWGTGSILGQICKTSFRKCPSMFLCLFRPAPKQPTTLPWTWMPWMKQCDKTLA